MGRTIELTAADGHRLAAYLAGPAGLPSGKARGGIVVVQEIFGVTHHLRAVTDEYAAAGYLALAPALFDRVERNVDVPYSDMQKGRGYMQATKHRPGSPRSRGCREVRGLGRNSRGGRLLLGRHARLFGGGRNKTQDRCGGRLL